MKDLLATAPPVFAAVQLGPDEKPLKQYSSAGLHFFAIDAEA